MASIVTSVSLLVLGLGSGLLVAETYHWARFGDLSGPSVVDVLHGLGWRLPWTSWIGAERLLEWSFTQPAFLVAGVSFLVFGAAGVALGAALRQRKLRRALDRAVSRYPRALHEPELAQDISQRAGPEPAPEVAISEVASSEVAISEITISEITMSERAGPETTTAEASNAEMTIPETTRAETTKPEITPAADPSPALPSAVQILKAYESLDRAASRPVPLSAPVNGSVSRP